MWDECDRKGEEEVVRWHPGSVATPGHRRHRCGDNWYCSCGHTAPVVTLLLTAGDTAPWQHPVLVLGTTGQC